MNVYRKIHCAPFAQVFATILLIATVAIGATAQAAASNVNGVVKGQVVDQNGSGVSGVSITLSDDSVGLERTVQSDSSGSFQMNLPAGAYSLKTEHRSYNSVVVESVIVSIGDFSIVTIPLESGQLEEIVVYGDTQSLINTGAAESALNISLEQVAMLPVARNVESVALLAPGTVVGDRAFGEEKNLVSFGGASVGENAYFINGLNVTNFRNGLGGSSVPFEFYDQFQIKTGGYGAQFGRSLGGVLNAITKTGSNDFHYGIVGYAEPAALGETSPDTVLSNGTLYDYNNDNEAMRWTTDVYVSGPIIRDRLFFYALYEAGDSEEEFIGRNALSTHNDRQIDDSFWGANLLWHINDRHSLSATVFTDERDRVTTQSTYDLATETVGAVTGVATQSRGGDNQLLRYDGQWTDWMAVSALYGVNEYNLTDTSTVSESCPLVVNLLAGGLGGNSSFRPGCEAAARIDLGADEREAYRLDFEFYFGNHTIRAGFDSEINTSSADSTYPGTDFRDISGRGVYYRYTTESVGAPLPNGGVVPDANGDGSDVDVVRWRISDVGGNFETRATAWYIEDTWDINDQFTLSLGLRNETFDNKNGVGSTFVKIDDQLAPRLGLVWSPGGDNESRVFANWGRYYIPVANNTNVRLSGAEDGRQRYFVFDGNFDPVTAAPTAIDGNGVPTTLEIGSELVTANGVTPDSSQLASRDLDPMYQDEYMLGYEYDFGNNWVVGARYIRRELQSGIDDILINDAVDALGYAHTGDAHGYVLANPGNDVTIPYDRFNTGVLELTTFPADLLGYPVADRTYNALELTVAREFDGKWGLQGSYTWSKNKGNTEGYVKSDNGQDDAGITQDFDQPQLMDGAFGYLPNDRRHKFKLFGNYQFNDNLLLGANLLIQSGRPVNNFGINHPNGLPIYGDTYYLTDPNTGELHFVPRGTAGRTDWITRLDLSAIYSFDIGEAGQVELRAEIFNVLDAASVAEVYEFGETGVGQADARWGAATAYQAPRSVRLGASIRF